MSEILINIGMTATTAFEIICGWSVAGAVFYNVIITACHPRSAIIDAISMMIPLVFDCLYEVL